MVGLLKYKRYAAYQLGFSFVGLAIWLIRNFGEVTLGQLFFHLVWGGEALLSIDKELVMSFLIGVLLLPATFAALFALCDALFSRHFRSPLLQDKKHWGVRTYNSLIKLGTMFFAWRGLIVIISGLGLFLQSVSAFTFFGQEGFGRDYFKGHYVHPDKVNISSKATKNLVLIYVESFEASYSDNKKFDTDQIPHLQMLEGSTFDRFVQVPGTGWTMAGIVASQCGVPLKNIFGGFDYGDDGARSNHFNKMGKRMRIFLPSAVCLGDILNSQGYRNIFIGGASGNFAGKEVFFRTHSYHEFFGREELESAGLNMEKGVEWGILNDQLFYFAREKLKRLQESEQKFNLTLLTLDTHGPGGLYSEDCRRRGAKDYQGIVKCSAEQIAEFVDFMERSGYLEHTRVVIMGDHLGMKTPISEELPKDQRFIYNKFLPNKHLRPNRNEIVHFDMFPTTLEFIGFDIDGDRLGLGFSAINELTAPLPVDRVEDLKKNVLNHSDTYIGFWK
jgi:phosphoglycerol transferase